MVLFGTAMIGVLVDVLVVWMDDVLFVVMCDDFGSDICEYLVQMVWVFSDGVMVVVVLVSESPSWVVLLLRCFDYIVFYLLLVDFYSVVLVVNVVLSTVVVFDIVVKLRCLVLNVM